VSKLTLSFKGKVLRTFPLKQGMMEIGSDPNCMIHIDSLAVQDKHARIETHGNDSILFDLKTEDGTFVNQNRITEHKLKDGDMIRVGKHTLTYKLEEISSLEANESSTSIEISPIMGTTAEQPVLDDTPGQEQETEEPSFQSSSIKHGWLQILNGQNLGKTLSLTRNMTNIGKPKVATAVITRRQEGYFISHLEGKHPPSVGNKEIGDQSVQLQDGDIITIGNINMQFYME
jgi:pSer/pThr/pTyr-binding forkhead associated (FHA) protein